MLLLPFTLSALLGALDAARAAPPPGGLTAQPLHAGKRAELAVAAAHAGATGPAASLVCRDLVPELSACLQARAKDGGRWVTRADLADWSLDEAAAWAAAGARLQASPLAARSIEGGGTWYEADASPELVGTVLLHPEWLLALGDPVLVAVPANGVLLAWSPGDAEVDRIMAVGVHKMYAQLDGGITPRIFQVDAQGWSLWGQAVPGR